MLDHALKLAGRGVHLFPLAPNSKIPLPGSHGVKEATTDAIQIEAWWKVHPQANIGIACGASGLVVLDIDRKHGVDGWDVIDSMMVEHGELPGTRMASTPNRGGHLYYRSDADIRPSCGKFGPGLDVRAGGSYVVAPPSLLDGRAYRWDLTEATAELPRRWVETLLPPKRPKQCTNALVNSRRARRYCIAALQNASEELATTTHGRRNHMLHAYACSMGGLIHVGGVTVGEIREAMRWAVSQWDRQSPAKDEATFERGLQWGQENPRSVSLG